MATKITEDKYESVKDLVAKGKSYRAACRIVGVSHYGLDLYCERNGLDKLQTRRKHSRDEVLKYKDAYIKGDMSQADIAKKAGCSQPYASRVLGHIKKELSPRTQQRLDKYNQIFEYVIKNGGYAVHAAEKLGIDLHQHHKQEMREYARTIGIDLEQYRMAGRKYGYWLTLPGFYKCIPPSTYYVPAICLSCGVKYDEVNLNNLMSGKSRGCKNCNKGHKGGARKVKRQSDGKVFSSIRAFCRAIDQYGRYQEIRIDITSNDLFAYNGEVYELIR